MRGTALAPAVGHATDRGSTDRGGGRGRVAHAIGRTKGLQSTQLEGGVLHLSHAESVSGFADGPGPAHHAAQRGSSRAARRCRSDAGASVVEYGAPDTAPDARVVGAIAH